MWYQNRNRIARNCQFSLFRAIVNCKKFVIFSTVFKSNIIIKKNILKLIFLCRRRHRLFFLKEIIELLIRKKKALNFLWKQKCLKSHSFTTRPLFYFTLVYSTSMCIFLIKRHHYVYLNDNDVQASVNTHCILCPTIHLSKRYNHRCKQVQILLFY